jgi:hypothetical protein
MRALIVAVTLVLVMIEFTAADDRGEGAIPWLPTRPPRAGKPPLSPRCPASDLRAHLQAQGATGNLIGGVLVRNSGRVPCSLRGRPSARFEGGPAAATAFRVFRFRPIRSTPASFTTEPHPFARSARPRGMTRPERFADAPTLGHQFTTLEDGAPISWIVADQRLSYDEAREPFLESIAERDYSEAESLPDHQLEHAFTARQRRRRRDRHASSTAGSSRPSGASTTSRTRSAATAGCVGSSMRARSEPRSSSASARPNCLPEPASLAVTAR